MFPFTANISFLFADRPFLDRIDAAARAGFDRVECHFPYEFSVAELRERLAHAGVRLTGLNTAPGDTANGEWGLACLAGREREFQDSFAQALHYASGLGASVIHVMAGVVDPAERAAARRTYIANLQEAAASAQSADITLLLEPLNSRDKPGYLVSRSDEIAEIIGEIGASNVKLLFDIYHVQIMEGDLIRRLERHHAITGHVQIAAVPSRAEPDEGEVNYRAIFETLKRIGYRGLVGLEYLPRGRTEDGLLWRKAVGCS